MMHALGLILVSPFILLVVTALTPVFFFLLIVGIVLSPLIIGMALMEKSNNSNDHLIDADTSTGINTDYIDYMDDTNRPRNRKLDEVW